MAMALGALIAAAGKEIPKDASRVLLANSEIRVTKKLQRTKTEGINKRQKVKRAGPFSANGGGFYWKLGDGRAIEDDDDVSELLLLKRVKKKKRKERGH
ncbi:conserved hypothetical protein [Ricinus communis]|uniref:Uncharacterized protein n=1 Tax=Ricinus communis TaxID=3988 RepID=B9SFG8_RICCO|nr:conserved hypothetical protein [Ricinus communis]